MNDLLTHFVHMLFEFKSLFYEHFKVLLTLPLFLEENFLEREGNKKHFFS